MPWETSGRVIDAAPGLRNTRCQPVADAMARGDTIVAIRLPGFAGLLRHRTQPGLDFAHELAERVRVIACPVHRPFLVHSDTDGAGHLAGPDDGAGAGPPATHLDGEALSAGEWRELRGALGAAADDAIVVVWAPREDAATAAREVLIRAREALDGVPAETRQGWPDGRTGFERLLPGPDRMYPDTDTPPLPIRDELVADVMAGLPDRPWEREARYESLGLDPTTARHLARSPWAELFDAIEPVQGDVARRVAAVLEMRVPYHARRHGVDLEGRGSGGLAGAEAVVGDGGDPGDAGDAPLARLGLSPARVAPLVRALEGGAILPSAFRPALDDLVRAPDSTGAGLTPASAERPAEDASAERRTEHAAEGATQEDAVRVLERYRPVSGDALAAEVAAVAARAEEVSSSEADAVVRWAMGEVLRPLRGRADPTEVRARLEIALSGERGSPQPEEAEARG
jgi:Glu-tRNA(Gln) amidotransferase subunit E-like FAD-binding protein